MMWLKLYKSNWHSTGRELPLNWQGTGRIRALKAINCTPANNGKGAQTFLFILVNRQFAALFI
jgi:hypothetical protein